MGIYHNVRRPSSPTYRGSTVFCWINWIHRRNLIRDYVTIHYSLRRAGNRYCSAFLQLSGFQNLLSPNLLKKKISFIRQNLIPLFHFPFPLLHLSSSFPPLLSLPGSHFPAPRGPGRGTISITGLHTRSCICLNLLE